MTQYTTERWDGKNNLYGYFIKWPESLLLSLFNALVPPGNDLFPGPVNRLQCILSDSSVHDANNHSITD